MKLENLIYSERGTTTMKTVAESFAKLVISYLAVVFVIMFMPVFLITKDIALFDSVIEYLFSNNR